VTLDHLVKGCPGWILPPCHVAHSRLETKSDRPIFGPWGPKNGQNGPFGVTDGKNGINICDGKEKTIILPIGTFWITSKTAML